MVGPASYAPAGLLVVYHKPCECISFLTHCFYHRDMPVDPEKQKQRKLLLTGLYLLIWGEAANLRFTPECLCYIFHHVSFHDTRGTNWHQGLHQRSAFLVHLSIHWSKKLERPVPVCRWLGR